MSYLSGLMVESEEEISMPVYNKKQAALIKDITDFEAEMKGYVNRIEVDAGVGKQSSVQSPMAIKDDDRAVKGLINRVDALQVGDKGRILESFKEPEQTQLRNRCERLHETGVEQRKECKAAIAWLEATTYKNTP